MYFGFIPEVYIRGDNMDKRQLVRNVSYRTGIYQTDVSTVIDTAIDEIKTEILDGNKVRLPGFGVFEPKKRAERTGRNPHTGEAVPIPARILPSFAPTREFKEAVEKECKL